MRQKCTFLCQTISLCLLLPPHSMGQVGRFHSGSPGSTSLLKQGCPGVHCAGLYPDGSGISLGRETPHPLWVFCSVHGHYTVKHASSRSGGTSVPQLLPIALVLLLGTTTQSLSVLLEHSLQILIHID